MSAPVPTPFQVQVDDTAITDLHERLDRTLWPQTIPGSGWDYGTDVDWLRDLCGYWRHGYDWRAQEAAVNAYDQYLVDIDGVRVHCIHAPSEVPGAMPLVLTHGWPSSFVEMLDIIEPLRNPAAYGGDPRDAFHVVVPSLPGYGFSSQPVERGWNAARVASAWVELMAAFGYERFASHGGDWGSAVTTALGAGHAERMIGLHFAMMAPPIDVASLTAEERVWWDDLAAYRDAEWGYVHLQRTKPMTPAIGLTDSPAGLAAWILEKWWRWTDCADEHGVRDPYRRFTRDQLLTNVSVYWFTRTIGSSLRMYYETFSAGSKITQPAFIDVPTGAAFFNEPNRPPRRFVEPWYDLRRYVTIDDGGHFPAIENPTALVGELRTFFRTLR
jgi:pimeloyl-ACP methyl ester carboxylesterase